jgi:hypothetical protein
MSEPVAIGGRGREQILDGTAALDEFVRRARYPSIEAAVAHHTVFLDPATVAQTGGGALFPVIRNAARRGDIDVVDGRKVMYCDNTSPTLAFLWAADRSNGPDIQFNHVWSRSSDPDCYTALWNLCCTPAFLAKTSDTHGRIVELLRYHSYHLYGHKPLDAAAPTLPDGYESLEWAAMPPPAANLQQSLRLRMLNAPKARPTIAARRIGWLYSQGPDTSLQ